MGTRSEEGPQARADEAEPWLARVRDGDFEAIPATLTFERSASLAYLVAGYEVAGGSDGLFRVLARVRRAAAAGAWRGVTALDAWLALFMAHRLAHLGGERPGGAEAAFLDALGGHLRLALRDLAPGPKAGIMATLAEAPGG